MRVLLAIDEPGTANELIGYVCSQSWKPGTEFMVLHVVQELLVGNYVSVLPSAFIEEMRIEAYSTGEALVRDAALRLRDHFHSPKITELVRAGSPGAVIVESARDNKIDLVIMGSKKRGLERLLLGSASAFVVAHSPCNVFVFCPGKTALSPEAELVGSAGK